MTLDEKLIENLISEEVNILSEKYNQANSLYCLALSILSYRDSEKIGEFVIKLNNSSNRNYRYNMIEDTPSGTQVLFFGFDDFATIAFRGTEFDQIIDIITDLKANVYENTVESNDALLNLPSGHAGFRRAIINLIRNQNIMQKLNDFCSQFENGTNTPIILTGHSLGGALSTLFIEPLVYSEFNFTLNYNFAAPLSISNIEVNELSNKYSSKTYDVINYKDYVPRAGSSLLRKLGRIGQFYWINKEGVLNKKEEVYYTFNFFEKLRFLKNIKKYHTSFGYYDRLRKETNSTLNILNRA